MNKIIPLFISLLALVGTFVSCNSTSEPMVYSSSTAVTSFKIQENNKVLVRLDSVYFSIDLMGARIFNADSMPMGTDVRKLILKIGYPSISSAKLYITDSKYTNDTIIDYSTSYNDSIDCSGKLQLMITSENGEESRVYDIMVNVHQQEPDSLVWNVKSRADLPTYRTPVAQKTIKFQESAYTLVKDNTGVYTIGVSAHPSVVAWNIKTVTFPFIPNVKSFTAAEDAMYILSDSGELYSSTDAVTWSTTSQVWHNIVGGYGDKLLGVTKSGDEYLHAAYPSDGAAERVADNFPVEGASQMITYSTEWNITPQAMIAGGVNAAGELIGDVWGYDGSRWGVITVNPLAPIMDATLFPYYTFSINVGDWTVSKHLTWFLVGGRDAKNNVSKDVFISRDLGLIWEKTDTLLRMPEYIPAFANAQALIYTEEYSAPAARGGYSAQLLEGWELTPERFIPDYYQIVTPSVNSSRAAMQTWKTPYIYIFGGEDKYGNLYNDIWKGVINRLEYQPLI